MAVNLKPREQCKWDAVALGEIMLRLDLGDGRIRTARTFQVWEGGGEYNVARGLRRCSGLLPHDSSKQVFASEVSLPVLNPRTIPNNGFDTYRLMDHYNDIRAMVKEMRFPEDKPSFYLLNVGETHYPYALPDEPPEEWPRISGIHGVFKHLDDQTVGGQLVKGGDKFFNKAKMKMLRDSQIKAVKYLDRVGEEPFDIMPKNTYITITADHGELFGEGGFFAHGPIMHKKVFEVPFIEGKLR
jgi:hypothetical protein